MPLRRVGRSIARFASLFTPRILNFMITMHYLEVQSLLIQPLIFRLIQQRLEEMVQQKKEELYRCLP